MISPLDLIVLILVTYGAILGYRRSFAIIMIEYAQVVLSLGVAILLFRPCGDFLPRLLGGTKPLAHLAAFVAIFLIFEVITMIATIKLTRRYARQIHVGNLTRVSKIEGAVANGLKLLMFAAAMVILLEALPFSGSDQRSLFRSPLMRALLSPRDPVSMIMHGVLGDDLKHGLGLLTIATDGEDDKLINLNFQTSGEVDAADEEQMLEYINTERARQGLADLKPNAEARTVARTYARDLFARGYFSHKSLDGTTPFDRLLAAKVPFGFAGENLALAPDVQAAHIGLMNSPPHRANILSPHYRTVGIGIIKSPDHGIMVVQDFTD